jgi:GT2 family glycosyltransferase
VGYFDEETAVISEDTDINLRIRQAGGKVYMNTKIASYYIPREKFIDFWRLYYRYGGAKAGILLKYKRFTSWRQTVPPLFLFTLIILSGASIFVEWLRYPLGGIIGIYLLVNLLASLLASLKYGKLLLTPLVFSAFSCMHFSYAFGYWKRLLVSEKVGAYWKH